MRDPTTTAGVASLKAGAQLARVVPSGKPVSTFVQLADDETQLHLRAKAKALRKGAREAVRLTDVLGQTNTYYMDSQVQRLGHLR